MWQRKALQELLANNPSGAEKIMKKVLQRYENDNMQTKYEATLAMVAILIHTVFSLGYTRVGLSWVGLKLF